MRRLVGWIDRDWERRRYWTFFAFGQRLLWIAPSLAAFLLMSLAQALGASPKGPLMLTLGILGAIGTLLLFGLSMYRWFVGYGRTGGSNTTNAEQRNKDS